MVKDIGVDVIGLVVSVDRMEKGKTEKSAISELSATFGLKGAPIVNMAEVVEYLSEKGQLTQDNIKKINDYYAVYGAK